MTNAEMTPAQRALAVNLPTLRVRAGFKSQGALAQKVGIAVSYVSMMERGERNPTLDVLERVAVALGVSTGELLAAPEEARTP